MKSFTQEERAEIQASYRDAKNRKDQIEILSQLYDCTENEIRTALHLPTVPEKKQAETNVTKRTRKKYDAALKKDALRMMLIDGEKPADLQERLGVPAQMLTKWAYLARKEQKKYLEPEEMPKPGCIPEPEPEKEEEKTEMQTETKTAGSVIDRLCGAAECLEKFCGEFETVGAFTEEEMAEMKKYSQQAWAFVDGALWAQKMCGAGNGEQ